MADEYQVTYEYTDGNTITFKTDDLKISPVRPHLRIHTRVDGTRVVTDTGQAYRRFSFTALIDGDTMDTLDSVQMAAIVYSGAYPRITVIHWDGDSTETNVEVALTQCEGTDLGNGRWNVSIVMEEKDQ